MSIKLSFTNTGTAMQYTEAFNIELITFDFGVGLRCWDTVSAVNAQLWLRFITVLPTGKMFGATGKIILL